MILIRLRRLGNRSLGIVRLPPVVILPVTLLIDALVRFGPAHRGNSAISSFSVAPSLVKLRVPVPHFGHLSAKVHESYLLTSIGRHV